MNRQLTAETLSRADLLALPPRADAAPCTIFVHRNHSFELVGSVLNAFLNEAGLNAACRIGDYDDSLSFAETANRAVPHDVDVHLIWLDAARYPTDVFASWLCGRVQALQQISRAPILVACCAAAITQGALPPGVLTLCLDQELGMPPAEVYSERLAALTGTRLSNQALLQCARLLGLRCIPALLRPALKALVLDLDNTLHEGVLGEDGAQGVRPRIQLQKHIKHLKEQGFLLALASKNEEADVRELFRERSDFVLSWDDFTVREIGWGGKAESIARIAARLNIGTDAMLFIDDNPGELLQASHALPGLHTLAAGSEEATLTELRWYPGLFKTRVTTEDTLRGKDIEANAQREAMQTTLDAREYLRQLNLHLDFFINPAKQLQRITELLNKTNQFILSFMRPGESAVRSYLDEADKCVITAGMRDCLSDSGIIAIAMLARKEHALFLEELVISCRALGRGVESDMTVKMLRLGAEVLGTAPAVSIEYKSGPRNGPGLAWLKGLSGSRILNDSGVVNVATLPDPDLESISVSICEGQACPNVNT